MISKGIVHRAHRAQRSKNLRKSWNFCYFLYCYSNGMLDILYRYYNLVRENLLRTKVKIGRPIQGLQGYKLANTLVF